MSKLHWIKRFTRTNPNIVKGTTYYEISEDNLDYLLNLAADLEVRNEQLEIAMETLITFDSSRPVIKDALDKIEALGGGK